MRAGSPGTWGRSTYGSPMIQTATASSFCSRPSPWIAERMSTVGDSPSAISPGIQGMNRTAAATLASAAGRRASGCAQNSQSSCAPSTNAAV